jgi:hypothetical protein
MRRNMSVLDKWVSHELNKNQIAVMKCVLRCCCETKKKLFSIELWRAWKVGLMRQQPAINRVTLLEWCSETLPRARVASKEDHGRSLVVCSWWIHYNVLNRDDTVTGGEVLPRRWLYAQKVTRKITILAQLNRTTLTHYHFFNSPDPSPS